MDVHGRPLLITVVRFLPPVSISSPYLRLCSCGSHEVILQCDELDNFAARAI